MRTKFAAGLAAAWMLALLSAHRPADAQLWKHFVPVSHTEAVPRGDLELTQDNGPWLIVAASFQGEGAEEQARELAHELRQRHRLAAYVHDRSFDFSEGNPGRGLDSYGAPMRTRYQREKAHEYAVLVGDFPSIDDPQAQQQLDRVKTLRPKCLDVDGDAGSSIDQLRRFSGNMLDKVGRQQQRGPLGKAFLSRNPLLPREYFVPKGVDAFVAKMNKGVEHSLLDCPGRYTVQVATFEGKTVLQTSGGASDSSAFGRKWRKDSSNPLVEAAEHAHLLTDELRRHGWEAYEFHDRTESIVTIGSFDQVAQRLPDGRVTPTQPVQRIIQTFGAAYDTPADPLGDTGNDLRTERQLEEAKQQLSQMLSTQAGQFAHGMHPKHVKIMRGNKVQRIIPMDVYPHTIDVPRRSVSGAYAGG